MSAMLLTMNMGLRPHRSDVLPTVVISRTTRSIVPRTSNCAVVSLSPSVTVI